MIPFSGFSGSERRDSIHCKLHCVINFLEVDIYWLHGIACGIDASLVGIHVGGGDPDIVTYQLLHQMLVHHSQIPHVDVPLFHK